MSRLPRNFIAGLPVHLVHRGNNRQAIFHGDSDRLYLRHCLADAAARYGVRIHSYVFMDNHVHLVATPDLPAGISRFIQSAARRYVGYFNACYRRTGTLWEGRFHCAVIGGDRYLLACHRYIDLNPVRAGVSPNPAAFSWSSHRYYAFGAPDDLVRPHATIVALGPSEAARRCAYRLLFDVPLEPGDLHAIRTASRTGRRLGLPMPQPATMGRPRKSRL